ncbi:MAG: ABC transporter substrate-binding protein [Acidimicrobiia bacterium]
MVLSACGPTAAPTTTSIASDQTITTATVGVDGFPVTIEAATGPLTLDEPPAAIVSLSPTATEMLFAIDAGDRVVAADEFSDFPPEAPTTDLSGFTPNVEAIASYAPDLVIASFDPGDLVSSLATLDIPVILQDGAVTIDDTYAQLAQLGQVTGQADEAEQVIAAMKSEIDTIVAGLPTEAQGLTYYHELDQNFFTATSTTFIGQMYARLGLVNIADEADPDGFGYPQLSAEYIIDRDPQLIFLADTICCGQNATTVAARPGWENLRAVANGDVIELDDSLASRWGPRVVDFLEIVSGAVAQALTG